MLCEMVLEVNKRLLDHIHHKSHHGNNDTHETVSEPLQLNFVVAFYTFLPDSRFIFLIIKALLTHVGIIFTRKVDLVSNC